MKNKTKGISVIIFLTYSLLIGLLVYNVYTLSTRYSSKELEMVVEIEQRIKEAVDTQDPVRISEMLNSARDVYDFDAVVLYQNEPIYQSIVYNKDDVLVNRIHPDAIAFESQGDYPGNSDYWIWYSVYRMNDSVYINSFLYTLLFISILATVLIGLTIILIARTLIKPLKTIETSIDLADDYKFHEIVDQEDNINKKFKKFTSSIQDNISVVSREHTELEYKLQSKRDLLNNTIVVSRSMVHDLKTPVHRNILENEIAERDTDNEEVKAITRRNQTLNQEVMMEINSILAMLKKDSEIGEVEKKNVELVELITRSFKRFQINVKQKGLFVNIDAPEHVVVKSDEAALTLLINNLLSNMVQYSKQNTELIIIVDVLESGVKLTFENFSDSLDIERMKKTEQIFNVIQSPKDGSHTYSSGNGLYLIENLVTIIEGQYSLQVIDDKVIIEVIIPHA